MKETEIYSLLLKKMKVNQNITQAEWSELDQAINQYFVDFKLKLYRICNLSDLEYQICLLLKLEVSLSDISTLVHREPSALTMSRKRLFKKMFKKEGKAEECKKARQTKEQEEERDGNRLSMGLVQARQVLASVGDPALSK